MKGIEVEAPQINIHSLVFCFISASLFRCFHTSIARLLMEWKDPQLMELSERRNCWNGIRYEVVVLTNSTIDIRYFQLNTRSGGGKKELLQLASLFL